MSTKRTKAAKPRRRAHRANPDVALAMAQAVGLLRGAFRPMLSDFENLIRVVEEKTNRCLYLPRQVAAQARSAVNEAERLLDAHRMAIGPVVVTDEAFERPMPKRAKERKNAAATDLLAAAQGIRRWSIDSATPIPDEFFRPLRDAIAKAEGRA